MNSHVSKYLKNQITNYESHEKNIYILKNHKNLS
jgi:hypothetical protein